MGVDIRVQSESGSIDNELLDLSDLTSKLLADHSDASSTCLRWVDPYGDTTFNQLQIPYLIEELEAVVDNATDRKIREHGQAILNLIREVKNEPHTYVCFVGD